MRKHARDLASHLDLPEIRGFVNRWWNASKSEGLFSPLNFTVKTHKPPKRVSLRVLHNGSGSPLGGLLHTVRIILSRRVKQLAHIVHATQEFTSKVSSIVIAPNDRFVVGDITDFFMAETHARLLHGLSLDPDLDFLVPCVKFLLEEQFVCLFNKIYRVKVGSGMGSQISSDLCDISFYWLAESHFICDSALQRHGVKVWLRYRDDIFSIIDSAVNAQAFFCKVRSCAGPAWKICVEAVSKVSVSFLDVEVFKQSFHDSGLPGFKPFSKPSKRFVPLSDESAHPKSVHLWPIADISRLARNSSNPSVFQHALCVYIHNMIEAQLDGGIIAHAISLFHGWDALRRSSKSANKGVRSLALSLGFHPLLPRARFHKILDSVLARYRLELELFLPSTEFRVTWKLLGPTFTMVLRRHGLQDL